MVFAKVMSDRHQWAKYEMVNEERRYYNPTFGGNLKEFIRRMVEEEGFTIGTLFPYWDGRDNCLLKNGIGFSNYEEMAYQALNHEHSNMDFKKDDNSQTISIMMSGDSYCDVIPINDWSYSRGQEDVVDRVRKSMRQEIMEDEA